MGAGRVTRIGYMSDLHTEFGGEFDRAALGVPEDTKIDLLVLAGDIGLLRAAQAVERIQDFEVMFDCPVVTVPGNHEYYRGVFGGEFPAGANFLDRDEWVSWDGKLRVLGATLWTDYKISGDVVAAINVAGGALNDHRLIRTAAGDLFSPHSALSQHMLSRHWLLERLAERHDGPTLIVTHHCPHSAVRNQKYPLDALSAAFCSDCNDVIEAAAKAGVVGWIFGHDHHCCDMVYGGVRFLSAQRGYPGEQTGWTGMGVLEI